MTLVKSHVCASCGGQLKVHEDRQIYECAFCGATFDYEFFQLRDLLDLASRSLKMMEFPSARQKYNFILTKDPHNFEALRGLVLCAAKVRSFDSFSNPDKCDLKSVESEIVFAKENALEEDKIYFERLSEMLGLSDEYKETCAGIMECELAIRKESESAQELEESSIIISGIPGMLIGVALCVGAFLMVNIIGYVVWQIFCGLVVAGVILWMILTAKKKNKLIEPHRQAVFENKSKAEELKKNASETKSRVDALFNELKEMKPEEEHEEVKTASEKTAQGECTNCGGELIINLERNVYECLFCGMTLDYEFVRDEDVYVTAIKAMKNGQFAEADDMFLRMLEEKPNDVNALFGRIMCAGKLNDVGTFRILWDEMVLLNVMKTRTQEAIDATEGDDKEYFGKIAEILENYEKYRSEANKENALDAEISSVRNDKEVYERDNDKDRSMVYFYNQRGELDGIHVSNSETDRQRNEYYMGKKETTKLLDGKIEAASYRKSKHSKAAAVFRERIRELYDEMVKIKPNPLPELETTNDN